MDSSLTQALKTLTYGLYIVTVSVGGTKNAMPASWVSQVSYDPPRIMVAVKKTRRTHGMLMKAGAFGLMVVQKGKESEFAAYKGEDPDKKFDGRAVAAGTDGVLLLTEYLTALDLKLFDTIDAGDHTLFIGEVVSARVSPPGVPATTLDYGKTYIGDY
ncbi:MAG: flavin reductase [Deltaproteobacteria bacterium]|nr:flavin reductase [Candidatus Zymogenaceae bacterium]